MKMKKILTGILSGALLMSLTAFPIKEGGNNEALSTAFADTIEQSEADKFLDTAYDNTRCTTYSGGNTEVNFKMSGRTYYQGFILGNGSYHEGSSVSFNIENINNIFFTLGHVDNSSTNNTTISIYCDDILVKQYNYAWSEPLKEESIDVSNYSKIRFESSCNYAKYAIGDININNAAPSKKAEIPTYKTSEEFINNNFSGWRYSVCDDSDSVVAVDRNNFKMSGRTYYQGVVLGDGSYHDGSSVSFNVENVNNISFTLGHVDNSSTNNTTISIYCDDILIKEYDISWSNPLKTDNLDVSNYSKIRFESSCNYAKYAIGDICINNIAPSTSSVVPKYNTSEEFINSRFSGWRHSGFDDSDSVVAVDRKNFKMSGRTYYQGVVLGDGSYHEGSSVSFNVENVNNILFTLGHVDNSNTNNTTISIYCDDKLIKEYELIWSDTLKRYSLDVSSYSKIRFESSCNYARYAIGDININNINPSTSSVVPIYKTAEEFIDNNFSGWRFSALDNSDSVEAVNRAQFKISGKTYYQGVVLGDGSYHDGSSASFSVENVNNISFTLGHVDDTSEKDTTFSVYLDNKLYDQFEITADSTPRQYSVDVSKSSKIRFESSCNYAKYALGNITLNMADNPSENIPLTPIEIKADDPDNPDNPDDPDTPTDSNGKIKGDANDDGVLNARDCAYIARCFATGKSSVLPSQTDYNQDGYITIRDAAAIARYLASKI